MNFCEIKNWKAYAVMCALALFLATAPQSFAQRPGTQASSQANNQTGRKQNANIQPVPNGAKMK
ncbi:MAG TPA: hypothetical protein PKC13_06780, partial [Blastocatellia bacterium]|nr:hypothetical protein [Blastocatellia bacterium]